ncbi:hypothetical protein F7725_009356 [Dissostichus mawsoni]|uniref:DRBM domain-containing protein n=1 Tax=Dissostichus mawsoni TaxID=36200 RepID=A0A7J5Z9X6_DISMA|nr:hypothetical protein F7725_009356 [Dissostichus mawsoni]
MQPDFVMVHHSGPDHRKNFLFKVTVNGVDYQPQTASPNKKHAKAMAATVALQALGEEATQLRHHLQRFLNGGVSAPWGAFVEPRGALGTNTGCHNFACVVSLLSHINKAHGRSPDFRVVCGINGCTEEYRVFNSFYYHIRRRHALYFENGSPPSGLMTTASEPSRVGLEHFDMPIFSGCATATRGMQRTNSQVSTCVPSQQEQQLEEFPIQPPDQRSVNDIVSGVQQYEAALLDTLRDKMKRVFERHSGSTAQLQEEALATFDHFQDPFTLMATTYMQDSTSVVLMLY